MEPTSILSSGVRFGIPGSAHSPERRRVFDDDAGRSAGEWDRQVLFLEKAHMLSHDPPGLIEAVFDRMTHPSEALQVGRVKGEKVGLKGSLDYERVTQVNHRSLPV